MPLQGAVDAHIHIWPELGGNNKPARYTAEDHFTVSRPAGVARTVLIQPGQFRFDNGYMLAAVRAHPGVFSAVAVVDTAQPPGQLDRLAAQLRKEGVRGFRVTNERAALTLCPAAAHHRLAICPLINPDALAWVDTMCARHPNVTVVIDHLARIGATGSIADADVRALCGLARRRRVHVKVSAFYALGRKQPPYLDLEPMIRQVFETYGPRRLMWGSDAPYQAQAPHTYQASVDLIGHLRFLSPEDRTWLLRRTCERVFF